MNSGVDKFEEKLNFLGPVSFVEIQPMGVCIIMQGLVDVFHSLVFFEKERNITGSWFSFLVIQPVGVCIMMRSQGEKWGVDSDQLTPSLYHHRPPPGRSENLLTAFENVKDVESFFTSFYNNRIETN